MTRRKIPEAGARRRARTDLSDADVRSLLLERRYLTNAAETCARWAIPVSQLRALERANALTPLRSGLRELVIVALRSATVREPAELVAFLDWQDHVVYAPDEIRAALDGLVAEGKAVVRDGAWVGATVKAGERVF